MDQGIGVSTGDLLSWLGAIAFYFVFMTFVVVVWRHPEVARRRSFPALPDPDEQLSAKLIRERRRGCVLACLILHAVAVYWVISRING